MALISHLHAKRRIMVTKLKRPRKLMQIPLHNLMEQKISQKSVFMKKKNEQNYKKSILTMVIKKITP